MLPFMVSRRPGGLKSAEGIVVLPGLEQDVDFEFHVADWLSSNGSGAHPVIPEVGMKVLCIYGADEPDSACRALNRNDFDIIEMSGGHHFGGDYAKLANIILSHAK